MKSPLSLWVREISGKRFQEDAEPEKESIVMPVVIVKTVDGASPEQKAALIERITEAMKDVLGKNPETTHVIIEEHDPGNWGLRGKTVAAIRAGK